MKETYCPNLVPPCYTFNGEWYDIERRCYVPAPVKPVYVYINGRRRQAQRWLWLWKIVAEVQGWLK